MSSRTLYSCDDSACLATGTGAVEGHLPHGWVAMGRGLHLCAEHAPSPRVQATSVIAVPRSMQRQGAEILDLVAMYFEIPPERLRSNSKARPLIWPRFLACYLLRTYTGLSLPAIAELMGYRDHTSVLHGLKRAGELRVEARKAEDLAELERLTRELE